MYQVIVIGAGPAGVSLSLYLKRAGINVLVLYNGIGSLGRAHIDNFYGYLGSNGETLFNDGLHQLDENNIEVKKEEVISIDYLGSGSLVETKDNKYETKYLVFATGISKSFLDKKFEKYLGLGVSLCALCDGPLYRNKEVYLTGKEPYLSLMEEELHHFTKLINIIPYDDIVSLTGDTELEEITLKDKRVSLNNLFIALPLSSNVLSSKLGLMIDKENSIKVNENYETNLKGIYAIGDAIKGVRQVARSVYDGMSLGIKLIPEVKKNENS